MAVASDALLTAKRREILAMGPRSPRQSINYVDAAYIQPEIGGEWKSMTPAMKVVGDVTRAAIQGSILNWHAIIIIMLANHRR